MTNNRRLFFFLQIAGMNDLEKQNRFKNRKGQVALKHLSMMETVVNCIYLKHAGKMTTKTHLHATFNMSITTVHKFW
jgi:hypothetical protein